MPLPSPFISESLCLFSPFLFLRPLPTLAVVLVLLVVAQEIQIPTLHPGTPIPQLPIETDKGAIIITTIIAVSAEMMTMGTAVIIIEEMIEETILLQGETIEEMILRQEENQNVPKVQRKKRGKEKRHLH